MPDAVVVVVVVASLAWSASMTAGAAQGISHRSPCTQSTAAQTVTPRALVAMLNT